MITREQFLDLKAASRDYREQARLAREEARKARLEPAFAHSDFLQNHFVPSQISLARDLEKLADEIENTAAYKIFRRKHGC